MVDLHDTWPAYDFATHKGYCTAEHDAALAEHGPSPVHRMRFVNVRRAAGLEPAPEPAAGPATTLGPEHDEQHVGVDESTYEEEDA